MFIFSSDLTGVFQIGQNYSYLIKYSALILFFDTIILIPFAFLRLNNKAKSFAGLKILNIVINVSLNLILILYFKLGIEAIFISNLAASVVTCCLQAVNKAQEHISHRNSETQADFIFVKTENRLEKIMISEIVYIEGMRDYRRIHTLNKKVMTLQNFSDFEKLIPSSLVCRVHKSYMVALHKIESIERSRIKIADQLIPISDTYKEVFFHLINNRL